MTNTILRDALTEAEEAIVYLRAKMRSIRGLDRFSDVTAYTTSAISQTDAVAKKLAALATADAEGAGELDHGDTVLRVQKALGMTDTGWLSPDAVLLHLDLAIKAAARPAPVGAAQARGKLTKGEAECIRRLALDLETTGRITSLSSGAEKSDFMRKNRETQCALEDVLRGLTEAAAPAAPIVDKPEPVGISASQYATQADYRAAVEQAEGASAGCECGQTHEWCKANDCPDLSAALKEGQQAGAVDGERYRWLRENTTPLEVDFSDRMLSDKMCIVFEWVYRTWREGKPTITANTLDKAIDAAIASANQKGEG